MSGLEHCLRFVNDILDCFLSRELFDTEGMKPNKVRVAESKAKWFKPSKYKMRGYILPGGPLEGYLPVYKRLEDAWSYEGEKPIKVDVVLLR